MIRRLEQDAAEAQQVTRWVEGDAAACRGAIDEALARASRQIVDNCVQVPEGYIPRLVVGTLIENIDQGFAGEGRSVWLRKGYTATPVALVGLGNEVAMSLHLDGGPVSIAMSTDGFSNVAAVKCRRLGSSFRGVEWRYDDVQRPGQQGAVELDVARALVAFPSQVPNGLDELWEDRLVAMLQPWRDPLPSAPWGYFSAVGG